MSAETELRALLDASLVQTGNALRVGEEAARLAEKYRAERDAAEARVVELQAQLDATFAEGVRLRGELDAETAERVRQQARAEGA